MNEVTIENLGSATIIRCNMPLYLKYAVKNAFMSLFSKVYPRQDLERILLVFSPKCKIDATGLGLLVHLHAVMVGSGKRLYLCMPPQALLDMLKERNLYRFLRILKTEQELLLRLPD